MSEHHHYVGQCVGGPLDGKQVTCHTSSGFVAVRMDPDRPKVWVYDRNEDDTFQVQGSKPALIDWDKLAVAQENGARSVMVVEDNDG